MDDRWKTIKGYKNYKISDSGVIVYNNKYHNTISYPKPRKRSDGYYVVSLRNNGKPKYFYLHRLLAQAFVPNPYNKPHINHKDGDKSNNEISNLEWCTASENSKHAVKNGLSKAPVLLGEKHGMCKLSKDDIKDIRDKYKTGNFKQSELAKTYGVTQSHISSITRGELWSHL